jgi:hypothetical protein
MEQHAFIKSGVDEPLIQLSNKQIPKVPLQISKDRKVCSEIKKSDASKNLLKQKDASPTSS